jgi:hypothetical protein
MLGLFLLDVDNGGEEGGRVVGQFRIERRGLVLAALPKERATSTLSRSAAETSSCTICSCDWFAVDSSLPIGINKAKIYSINDMWTALRVTPQLKNREK